jgi:energy-coupling factor transporter ATP-binding protein EcfA2
VTGTLGDVLTSRRGRRFVGRAAEIELFRAALAADEPPFSVLYLHGPAGIGKTSLLDVLSGIATQADATVIRLDGRDLVPTPPGILDALRGVLHVPAGDGRIDGSPTDGRLAVLIDSYERIAPLDDWVRIHLLPRLPSDAVAVLASRTPPTTAWRADPAWRELLRVVSLRNLSPEESQQYLDACGVDSARHEQLVALAHGYPLALSLLADVVVRGGEAATADPMTPDLVGTLLRRLVEVTHPWQRRSLDVCAVARVTTEALLRDALELDDALDLFTWLRELSFIESGPDGLYPQDLARDVLVTDLRWRDPDGYRRVFRKVRDHINDRLQTSRDQEQQRAIADAKYAFRHLPGVVSPVAWDVWGQRYPEPARIDDRDSILDLVRIWEGETSAGLAARWWDRQPDGFFVIRGDGDAVDGVIALLDLTAASVDDVAADPGARAAWHYAQQHAPPRPTETVTQTRFLIDRQAYQGPSATINATPLLTMQRYLGMPLLAWDFLTMAEPERWDAYFAVADLPRAVGADFTVDGRRYGLFGHDFRQVPIYALLELVTERALTQDVTPTEPTQRAPILVLSQPEFDDSVRQALRDLRRPDLLGRNPLLQTRVVRDRSGAEPPTAATLQALLSAAFETLAEHPRDDKLWRAVERTYVRPAATQERAAAALGLPFSTYRRHLTQGVSRIVAWLWDQEVYGSSAALSSIEQH